jgi:hypothetical protein
MHKFRLFNASPGDVADERVALAEIVIPELRRILGAFAAIGSGKEIELEAVRWETHSWPDVGADAQDVINRQLTGFDIFLGIMWKRFGTPTKRAGSGTGEEFERAFELYSRYGVPRIMFYFRTTAFYPQSSEDIDQFRRVFEFKERLEKLGVRYWEYEQPIDFERYVREHLIRQILDLTRTPPPTPLPAESPLASTEPITERPIFISYSPEDREAALRIASALQEAGAHPWLDVNSLLPGQDWQQEVAKAIRGSSVFLILLSRGALAKRGYVQREIQYALEEMDRRSEGNTYLIPVRLEDCPLPPKLATLQWVDMFPDWTKGLERIKLALKALPNGG